MWHNICNTESVGFGLVESKKIKLGQFFTKATLWLKPQVKDFIKRSGCTIALDLIFIKNLQKCVDWSKIDKTDYFDAMEESCLKDDKIKAILNNALTDKINDRDLFMKGINTSYIYEEV